MRFNPSTRAFLWFAGGAVVVWVSAFIAMAVFLR